MPAGSKPNTTLWHVAHKKDRRFGRLVREAMEIKKR
jgi:hypothetical protein